LGEALTARVTGKVVPTMVLATSNPPANAMAVKNMRKAVSTPETTSWLMSD
jgi:hypothetical protein